MEAISRLIFNRLARRERVVLPGIGVLYTARETASADAGGNLTPPRTNVYLGPTDETDTAGENLSEAVAEASGIPLREIRPQVHRWLAELKNTSSGGSWAIDGVVNVEASGTVTPSPELDALLNPLGEEKIHMTPAAAPVYVQEREKRSTAGIGWWILLGLLLGLLVWLFLYRHQNGTFPAPVERILHREVVLPPVAVPETPAPVPAVVPDSVIVKNDTIPAVEPVGQPVVEAVKPAEPVRAWRVVVGVYSTRQNAQRAIRESGLDASRTTIVSTSGGYYRVGYGQFDNKEAADRESARMQGRFPGAWVARF